MTLRVPEAGSIGSGVKIKPQKAPKLDYNTHEFNKTNINNFEQEVKKHLKSKNKAPTADHVSFEQECLKKAAPQAETTAGTATKASLADKVKGKVNKMNTNISPKIESFKAWYNTPLTETRVYDKLAGASQNGLDTVAGKSLDFVSKNAAAEGKMMRLGVKAAEIAAPAASKTSMFIGGMKEAIAGSKLFTKGNFALAALSEAPDLVQAFKEGRGINQAAQSTVKVGASAAAGIAATAGAVALGVISGPVGWAALGVGLVGSMVGYTAGDKLTSFLGHNKTDEEKVAEAQNIQAQPLRAVASNSPSSSFARPVTYHRLTLEEKIAELQARGVQPRQSRLVTQESLG